jgi:hypothetical protein
LGKEVKKIEDTKGKDYSKVLCICKYPLAEPKALGLRAPQRGLKKPGVREIAAGLKDEYRKGIQKKTEDARKTPPGLAARGGSIKGRAHGACGPSSRREEEAMRGHR